LWDDITALLQHQETGDISGLWTHFLGAIVLELEQTVPGQIPRFTVIDGQERLTTLQLLLAAAASAVAAVGAENDAALLRDLAINNPRKATGTEQLKVWPTNANRAAFTAVMAPEGPSVGHADEPANRIVEAFTYFADRVTQYIRGTDDDESEEPEKSSSDAVDERAKRLRITLCDLLKLVSITLEPGDNAQVIFETLNARGTPLLALDLVKNAAFPSGCAPRLRYGYPV